MNEFIPKAETELEAFRNRLHQTLLYLAYKSYRKLRSGEQAPKRY